MVKTFAVWVEDQLEKKRLIRILLDRLGYDRSALDNNNDIIITDRKLDNIIDAINALPVGEENQQAMITFAQQNQKNLSLRALANKINVNDAESQDKTSSVPATLPQGNQPAPKPFNKQMQQQQQEPNTNLLAACYLPQGKQQAG
jgi:hypothetical protein